MKRQNIWITKEGEYQNGLGEIIYLVFSNSHSDYPWMNQYNINQYYSNSGKILSPLRETEFGDGYLSRDIVKKSIENKSH